LIWNLHLTGGRQAVDVSVVVTAHREGRLLHRTLRSVWRSLGRASARDISAELIIVVDKPDDATLEYLETVHGRAVVEHTQFGDPGQARNHGARIAAGRYVAFLDGDDLMGSDWISGAFHYAESIREECVYYPEYVIQFEGVNAFLHRPGTTDPGFRATSLLEANCWNSVHFLAPRALLLSYPFDFAGLWPRRLALVQRDGGAGHTHCHRPTDLRVLQKEAARIPTGCYRAVGCTHSSLYALRAGTLCEGSRRRHRSG
jgi:glycosyltransferase involved in cell wall biosynthesis